MKDTVWLTANGRGVTKMTKSEPAVRAGEITFKIRLSAPSELFRMPTIEAEVEVGDEHVLPVQGEVEIEPAPEISPEGDDE